MAPSSAAQGGPANRFGLTRLAWRIRVSRPIDEAFSAQILFHSRAWESPESLRDKAGVKASLGAVPSFA
jgi:hypothetical protein